MLGVVALELSVVRIFLCNCVAEDEQIDVADEDDEDDGINNNDVDDSGVKITQTFHLKDPNERREKRFQYLSDYCKLIS